MLDNAKWISHSDDLDYWCPIFLKSFSIKKNVKSATLCITSRGCYYAELNGKRIGDFIFAPGCTSLKRIQMQEYDIKPLLKDKNDFTVTLSRGWYRGRINIKGNKEFAGKSEALIAEIVIIYENGEKDTVVTDESWLCSRSKIRFEDFYDGEHFDSTFSEPFAAVCVKDYDKSVIVKQHGEKIIEHEKIIPKRIFKAPNGETIIDFGQNITPACNTRLLVIL